MPTLRSAPAWFPILLSFCPPLLAQSRPAGQWRVEDLGVPIRAVTYGNSHAALAAGPKGEGRMFYTSYYCSTGAELVGHDFRTGESLRRKIPSDGGYAVVAGNDGCIYVGGVNPGNVYRYDARTDALTTIDLKPLGVGYTWDAAVAPDGTIYCASGYPQARLVAYDPKTAKVRDLGVLAVGEEYMRSVCVDPRGKVWCGIGTHAHLAVYDPVSGTKTEVLPKKHTANSFVYSLQAVGDYVVAGVAYKTGLLIYDASSQKILHEIQVPAGQQAWMAVAGGSGHTGYLYTFPSLETYRCDLRDGTLTKIAEGIGQPHVIEVDRWLHGTDDQCYIVYDLQERKMISRLPLTEGGDGMDVFSLAAGPDGNIYGSTYINMHMFRCESASGKFTDLGKVSRWPGQVDSLSLGRDGKLYIGAYINAVLSVYEPDRPIRPGTSAECNPREIGAVGKGQYRTRANCLGPDGRLYVGSVPAYNTAPTGAFTICDLKSGKMDARTDFVAGGAVHYLVSDDRFVYGAGGGEFFVYDPPTDKKVFSVKRQVSALAVLPNSKVVGTGGGKVFVYDRNSNAIAVEKPNRAGDFTHMAVSTGTGSKGRAYGVNSRHVARVDPDANVEILTSQGGQYAALDPQGRFYFARGSHLLRCSGE